MPFVSGVSQIFGAFCLEGGIKTEPAKIEALKTWSRPTKFERVESFIRLCGVLQKVCV